jgi:hypothetical protein
MASMARGGLPSLSLGFEKKVAARDRGGEGRDCLEIGKGETRWLGWMPLDG